LDRLSAILIQNKICRPSLAKSLAKNESESPSGLVVSGFGISFAEADGAHVLAGGLAVGVLSSPVAFRPAGGHGENVRVKLAFVLAAAEPAERVGLRQALLAALADKLVLEKMWSADSPEDVIEIVRVRELGLQGKQL
jgi:PTS system galactitol-specific IIA component